MSGFDGLFRTQQWVEGMRNESTDYAGARYIESAQTALGVARDLRDYQMRAVESAAKMKVWETENQINQQKLLQLQALDMTEMGRLEVMSKLQSTQQGALAIEASRFALDQEKKRASMLTDDQQKEMALSQWESQVMGKTPLDRAMNGWINRDGKWVRAANPDERSRAIAEAKDYMRASRGASDRDWERELMLREIGQMQDLLSSSNTNFDAEYTRSMRDRLKALQADYDKRYRPKDPGKADPQQETDSPAASQRGQRINVTDLPIQAREVLGKAIKSSVPWDNPRLAPMSRQPAVWEAIEELMAEFLMDKKRYSPEQAAQLISQQLLSNQAMMADVLRRAGYSKEQVQSYFDVMDWNKGKNETFLKRMYEGEGR